jgi:ribosomal protein S18 acetylase RimI-like enzyme
MTITIRTIDAPALARQLGDLAALLHACVHGGANIGFILPHALADAERYWQNKVAPAVAAGGVLLLGAYRDGALVGTVQLDHDTPGNQAHRAEVRKLLVHPELRRQGVARLLMAEVERHAGTLQRQLLTLDTRTDSPAEPLYVSLGYQRAGIIPGYCRDTHTDRLDATTIMYKALGVR